MLNHIQKITIDTPSSIANQLCLAVADLFCQMVEWTDAIPDIVKRYAFKKIICFRLSSTDVTSLYLIDILKFIPEEVGAHFTPIMNISSAPKYLDSDSIEGKL